MQRFRDRIGAAEEAEAEAYMLGNREVEHIARAELPDVEDHAMQRVVVIEQLVLLRQLAAREERVPPPAICRLQKIGIGRRTGLVAVLPPCECSLPVSVHQRTII